jgi:hypothetical protein
MLLDDPSTWVQGFSAFKTAVDSVRSAISIVKDVRSLGGGSEKQHQAIDNALAVASSTTAIAEAELAKAFGYELCKCQFPPTPMKTIGYRSIPGKQVKREAVYECPKCGYNTAAPFTFTRIAPPRTSAPIAYEGAPR